MSGIARFYQPMYEDIQVHILPQPEWFRTELARAVCRRCRGFRRDAYPRPIDAHTTGIPLEYPIGVVSRVPVGIIRKDLESFLAPWPKDFAFGRCYGKHDEPILTHSTFYSRDFLSDRFGPGTQYECCPECGLTRTHDPRPPRYSAHTPILDRELLHDSISETWVSERLYRMLESKCIERMMFFHLPVFDRPIDEERLAGHPA